MPADDLSNLSNLPARYVNGRFGPGNPGRRPGSRDHASRRTAMPVLQHFERNRDKILDHMALSYTPADGALIGRLLPRQVELSTPDLDDLSQEEAARVLARHPGRRLAGPSRHPHRAGGDHGGRASERGPSPLLR